MKKLNITISALLILLILYMNADAKNNTSKSFADEVDLKTLKSTKITPVLDSPINTDENLIYCSTFQMAWNELCNKYAKGTLEIEKAPDYVEKLNALYKQLTPINENSYLAISGTGKDKILDKINKAVRKKFGYLRREELPPKFSLPLKPKDVIAFACLYKNIEFEKPFVITDPVYTIYHNKIIKYNTFGFYDYLGAEFKNQFKVLYYQVKKYPDFENIIINFFDKSSEEVLISTMPVANTLKNTYNDIVKVIDSNKGFKSIEVENICIPRINFNVIDKYKELLGKKIGAKSHSHNKYIIKDAIQKIAINMNANGSKSFLRYSYMGRPYMLPINIKCPFVIYIKKKSDSMPYFMAYIATPELFDINKDNTIQVLLTSKTDTLDVEILSNPISTRVCSYYIPSIEIEIGLENFKKFINAEVEDGSNTLLLILKRKTFIQSRMQIEYKKEHKSNESQIEEHSLKATKKYYYDIIEYLIKNGAEINSSNNSGLTPLICAVDNGDFEIVKLLLESGADIKAKRKDGKSALAIAKEKKNEKIIKLLLKQQK